MQNFELISFPGADELARATAAAWLDEIEAARRAGRPHCVALSGGRIAHKFFTAVVAQAQARAVAFDHVHFFWADERCVPPTDPESNFKLADEWMLAPLKITAEKLHRVRGEDSPSAAAKTAEAELCGIVPQNQNKQPVLDLILLGLGEDGHVASLFPGAPPPADPAAPFWVIENSPKPPPVRISLSLAAIAAARQVWVLVAGAGKAPALQASMRTDGATPLAQVLRQRRATKLFCDQAGF